MIAVEREIDEQRIYYKSLRLISPEKAQRLELPAEGPIFVSPDIYQETSCEVCGCEYGPLVYRIGIVRAQHFHKTNGGIYYVSEYSSGRKQLIMGEVSPFKWNWRNWSWLAFLRPRGEYLPGRAEEVEIIGINAYCPFDGKNLKSGFVVPAFGSGRLTPICRLGEDNRYHPYQDTIMFQISDIGEVHFSKI